MPWRRRGPVVIESITNRTHTLICRMWNISSIEITQVRKACTYSNQLMHISNSQVVAEQDIEESTMKDFDR